MRFIKWLYAITLVGQASAEISNQELHQIIQEAIQNKIRPILEQTKNIIEEVEINPVREIARDIKRLEDNTENLENEKKSKNNL